MSRFYAAVTCEDTNGKLYAYVINFTDSDNALFALQRPGILHANIYTTKKRASEIADFWNECYKKNGTYKFA